LIKNHRRVRFTNDFTRFDDYFRLTLPAHEGNEVAAMTMRSFLSLTLAALALAAATGCSHVAPYERAKIAHPSMAAGDLAGTGESHVRAVLEGARGGSLGAESGCGCN
jgi:hypothetical protein